MKIIINEGTCGLASGAKSVRDSFAALLPSATIKSVGCLGLCHQEVTATIIDSDKTFFYGRLNAENVERVVNFHLHGGPFPADLVDSSNYLTKQTRIALRNIGLLDPLSLEDYVSRGGYTAIKKILSKNISPEEIIKEVKTSGLRGRGGAGFSTWQKWDFARNAISTEKYVICNGDEGDPGAFMDRSLLEGDPHSVLEGMMITARAIGANHGYAYIRAEYPLAIKHFSLAIENAKKTGLLGKNILGSDFTFEVKIKQGAGAFVCGEETAMIRSIEGDRGMPRVRPPFPAISGLFSKPTIINNVETLVNLPWILTQGGTSYASFGTGDSKGTKVFALAGAIKRGGLVEVPMGTSLREVIEVIGGGSRSSLPVKAVQLGGPSGGCVPASLLDTPITYEAITATGAIMGSGGMIVLDEKTCMVDLARYFLEFTRLESCGKCTFCRIGTLRMKELLDAIAEGRACDDDLRKLEELANQVKITSLCGLGQTAPNPVLTTLKYFREEYLEHINNRRCPAGVCKKLIHHEIIKENCIACNLCKKSCPVSAITGTPKEKGSYSIDSKVCINCGLCLEVCRFNAIKVN